MGNLKRVARETAGDCVWRRHNFARICVFWRSWCHALVFLSRCLILLKYPKKDRGNRAPCCLTLYCQNCKGEVSHPVSQRFNFRSSGRGRCQLKKFSILSGIWRNNLLWSVKLHAKNSRMYATPFVKQLSLGADLKAGVKRAERCITPVRRSTFEKTPHRAEGCCLHCVAVQELTGVWLEPRLQAGSMHWLAEWLNVADAWATPADLPWFERSWSADQLQNETVTV